MFLNYVFITSVVGESSSRSWWDVSRVVWMLEHWSHMISWQFRQTDDAATLHCLDIWHTLQFAISLVRVWSRPSGNQSIYEEISTQLRDTSDGNNELLSTHRGKAWRHPHRCPCNIVPDIPGRSYENMARSLVGRTHLCKWNMRLYP